LFSIISPYANGADAPFTDELISNPLDSAYFRTSEAGTGNITSTTQGVNLAASAYESGSSRAYFHLEGLSDYVEIRGGIKSDSVVNDGDDGSFRLIASFHNDTQDGGFDDRTGDIISRVELRKFSTGIYPRFCFNRSTADGDWQETTIANGSTCETVPVTIVEDQHYTLRLEIDRQAGTVTASIDSYSQTYNVVGAQNTPSRVNSYVGARTNLYSNNSKFSAEVAYVETELYTLDLTGNFDVSQTYRASNTSGELDRLSWDSSGIVTLNAITDGTSSDQSRLQINSPTDSIEALLSISSTSNAPDANDERIFGTGVAGTLYNDQAHGGIDRLIGDVFATSEIHIGENGSLIARYCLFRSDSVGFSEFSGALSDGEQCAPFSTTPLYDTYYAAKVAMDWENKTVIFSFNNEEIIHNISGTPYAADGEFKIVRAFSWSGRGNGEVVANVDGIVTGESNKPSYISSPLANSSLACESEINFSWNDRAGYSWWLYLGSMKGQSDLLDTGSTIATAVNAANLPEDGSRIYARLWYRAPGGSWSFTDSEYDACNTATVATPEITAPSAGSELSGSNQQFTWTSNGSDAAEYWLYIGPSEGSNDYFDSKNVDSDMGVLAQGLPVDGSTLHARLWYRATGSSWSFVDSTYTAATNPTSQAPSIDSHSSDATLAGDTDTITWSDPLTEGTEYWIYAGSSQGQSQFDDSGNIGNVQQYSLEGLPTDGSDVWIRLWYKRITGGGWQFLDLQLRATTIDNQAPAKPTLLGPSGDNAGFTPLYTWEAVADATWYQIWVSVGGGNIINEWYTSAEINCAADSDVCSAAPFVPVLGDATWWVRAWNNTGGNGAWSAPLQFSPQ
jgi:hypothetical protein